MNRIVLHSRVGTDGVLQLTVPIGVADADRKVEVTIAPLEEKCRRVSARKCSFIRDMGWSQVENEWPAILRLVVRTVLPDAGFSRTPMCPDAPHREFATRSFAAQ